MTAAYDQALAELREATVAVFTSELDLIEAVANARDAGATTDDLRAALERILSGRFPHDLGWAHALSWVEDAIKFPEDAAHRRGGVEVTLAMLAIWLIWVAFGRSLPDVWNGALMLALPALALWKWSGRPPKRTPVRGAVLAPHCCKPPHLTGPEVQHNDGSTAAGNRGPTV